MKKIILLSICLLILAGCSGKKAEKRDGEKTSQAVPKEEASSAVEEKKIKSPLDALLETKILNFDNPSDIYPRTTQLRFDYQPGSNKMKVFISSDGLPDDVLKKQDYQIDLKQQEDGNWEIAGKKIIREECWPGRSCK